MKRIFKSNILKMVIVFIVCFLTFMISSLIPCFAPSNKINSISHLFTNSSNEAIGIVAPFETYDKSYGFCPIQPEKTNEIRSLDNKNKIVDVYPVLDESTPFYIENINASILLAPKEKISDAKFAQNYDFALIEGAVSRNLDSDDIFINQTIADKLIEGEKFVSYKDLINKQINAFYTYANSSSTTFSHNYVIRGIIDNNCTNYQYYKNYIGDFVVGTQYLSLPYFGVTLFDIDRININTQLKRLDRVYKYSSEIRNFDALKSLFTFEYQIYYCEYLNSNLSILKLKSNGSGFDQFKDIYAYFRNLEFIIPLIFSVVLTLFFLISACLLIYSFLIVTDDKKIIYSYFLTIFMSYILSLLIPKRLFNNLLHISCLNFSYWWSLIFSLIAFCVVLVTIYLLKRKHKIS